MISNTKIHLAPSRTYVLDFQIISKLSKKLNNAFIAQVAQKWQVYQVYGVKNVHFNKQILLFFDTLNFCEAKWHPEFKLIVSKIAWWNEISLYCTAKYHGEFKRNKKKICCTIIVQTKAKITEEKCSLIKVWRLKKLVFYSATKIDSQSKIWLSIFLNRSDEPIMLLLNLKIKPKIQSYFQKRVSLINRKGKYFY